MYNINICTLHEIKEKYSILTFLTCALVTSGRDPKNALQVSESIFRIVIKIESELSKLVNSTVTNFKGLLHY